VHSRCKDRFVIRCKIKDEHIHLYHRIKISNRRATQRCNVSAFFYAKICSLLARRRSSQPVQRVYWPENVIDWLGRWRPTCVMRHARGQKLQSFRRKWPFYMDLYSMPLCAPGMIKQTNMKPFQIQISYNVLYSTGCPQKNENY
jgi:hypothetical protein